MKNKLSNIYIPERASHNFGKKEDIIKALFLRGESQESLFACARKARDEVFAGRIEVRSVIEYSNICQQACNYCGMNRYSSVGRYILSDRVLLEHVHKLYQLGRRVIMFQTGEFHSQGYFNKLYSLLKKIKQNYSDISLVCSFGNLSEERCRKLRDIGTDRYLLKFETSDTNLYKTVKPSDTLSNRLAHIRMLKRIGFQVSSGNITGLPGQSLSSLANDLLLLKQLDLPMGSTSPFIPNDLSNYAHNPAADLNLALNFMAILRIMCPKMLIPTTSALALLAKNGQQLGLVAGANTITLHDGTPKDLEKSYVLYKRSRYKPAKLFDVVKNGAFTYSNTSILRDKLQDSLFYKLINANSGKEKIAVYFEGKKYTYRDLLTLCSKFCSFLESNRIQEGQKVILSTYDSIEFIIAFLSCIRLGIVVIPVEPQLNDGEWSFILSDFSPQFILATENVHRRLRNKRVLKIADDDSSEYFFSLIKKEPESKTYISSDKNNPALILCTSGTTGRPKGVIHTYKDLFVDNFPRTILKMSGKDIIFSYSRIYTSFGLGNSLLFPFHFGSSVILSRTVPNSFSLQKILELRPTLFFAVPSIYELLLDEAASLKPYFKRIRLLVCSGEKLYSDIYERWESVYKSRLLECYGTSEMCHPFISNIPGNERMNSCGSPVEGFGVKFNKRGRIFYRGPSLTPGYYADDVLSRDKIRNGWFESDDIGYADREGFIFIKGRSNLVFKLYGRWVSLLDIEEKLRKCQLVKEIVVIKKRKGLAYYVSLSKKIDSAQAEKEIRHFCMHNLQVYELPKTIHILAQIPKTRTGKFDRRSLEKFDTFGDPAPIE